MAHARETAEILALQAFGWLLTQQDLLPTFLGSTGAGEDELKARASDPEFLGAVLDFLLMDDAWVMAFCDQANVPYDRVMPARMALPGGEQVHWT